MVWMKQDQLNGWINCNPVYNFFSRISTLSRFAIVILVFLIVVPVRLLAEEFSQVPKIIWELVALLYLWMVVNVLAYAVITSSKSKNERWIKNRRRNSFFASCISTAFLVLYSATFLVFSCIPEINGPFMLKSKTSASEEYTVKIYGNRDTPFSGYDGDVYLYYNLTGERDYVCHLTNENHLYIHWESEYIFTVNNMWFEIHDNEVYPSDST